MVGYSTIFTFASCLLQLSKCSPEVKRLDLVEQNSVPFIAFSHKLVNGILTYQNEYDHAINLSLDELDIMSKKLINPCNSETYMFVNIPGLTKMDFIDNEDSFISLKKYIFQSSTAVKFEKVDLLDNQFYDNLIDFTKDTCRIQDVINIIGNDTESFKPFYNARKRILKIDYPQLPSISRTVKRTLALSDYDRFLRSVLAQIPSPDITVILTSLNPDKEGKLDDITPEEIFPNIFNHEYRNIELERNNRIKQDRPKFNKPRPKFEIPKNNEKYVSVFNKQFINENKPLLISIILTLIATIMFQYMNYQNDHKNLKKMVDQQVHMTKNSRKPIKKNN